MHAGGGFDQPRAMRGEEDLAVGAAPAHAERGEALLHLISEHARSVRVQVLVQRVVLPKAFARGVLLLAPQLGEVVQAVLADEVHRLLGALHELLHDDVLVRESEYIGSRQDLGVSLLHVEQVIALVEAVSPTGGDRFQHQGLLVVQLIGDELLDFVKIVAAGLSDHRNAALCQASVHVVLVPEGLAEALVIAVGQLQLTADFVEEVDAAFAAHENLFELQAKFAQFSEQGRHLVVEHVDHEVTLRVFLVKGFNGIYAHDEFVVAPDLVH